MIHIYFVPVIRRFEHDVSLNEGERLLSLEGTVERPHGAEHLKGDFVRTVKS